ncbi:hypothetical protein [Spirosoma endbachense]|uniref:hypothetical protein n=1 Tax=Spirosoma endbachense TaxID=2666025 RepID=UPI003741EDEF
MWVACVHAANQADGAAAINLIGGLQWRAGERLEKVFGDQAARRSDYNGNFARSLANWSIVFEKVSRPESGRGFVPIAKRWVVERSIAWTNFFRRIVKDYEYTTVRRCGIFFGKLALISQYSGHATANRTSQPNLIPQHVLRISENRVLLFTVHDKN